MSRQFTPEVLTTGPAIVKWRSQYYWFQNGVTIAYNDNPVTLTSDAMDHRRSGGLTATITGTPMAKAALSSTNSHAAALLYPVLKQLGQRLFLAGADDPLEVIEVTPDADGKYPRTTFKRAAVTTLPGLNFAANAFAFSGSVVWTALWSRTAVEDDDDGFLRTTDVLLSALPSGHCTDDADVPIGPVTGYWHDGSAVNPEDAPWYAFTTLGGVQVAFNVTTNPVESDLVGVCDYTVTSVNVEATFQPAEPTAEEVFTRLTDGAGTRRVRGSRLAAGPAYNLAFQSPAGQFMLKKAVAISGPRAFARQGVSNAGLTVQAQRVYGSSCAPGDLFALIAANDAIFTAPAEA